jgi:hypothetical protein
MTDLAARPNTPLAFAPPIGLLAFAGWGLALFAAKFALDHSVARFGFGRGWAPWGYLVTSVPLSALIRRTSRTSFSPTAASSASPPLDGGRRTRIAGTTWYEHNLWPAGYWRVWSNHIIHRIHGRVLNHVKRLSEQASL